MRSSVVFTTTLSALASLTTAQSGAGYVCPITPPEDATAVEFAYAIQKFLYNFYEANGDYMESMFSSFPNASMLGHDDTPLSADLATNFAGLKKQSQLAVEGIQQLSSMAGSGYQEPSCDYSYPPGFQSGGSAMDFLMSAYFMEATLCGAFIGLADYVQTPQAAFLMARIAAEHGIHGSFLGSYLKDTPFSAESMALTPAFTPQQVLQMGSGATRSQVGKLGQYIPASCAPVPPAPCGGSVSIGMINSMLSGAGMGSGMGSTNGTGTMSGYGSASSSGSASMPSGYGGMSNSSLPEQQISEGSLAQGSLALISCTIAVMALAFFLSQE